MSAAMISGCSKWGSVFPFRCPAWQADIPGPFGEFATHKARWQADHVIVEGAGSGIQLVQQLKRDGQHRGVMTCTLGVGNKEARLIEQSARLTSGQFVIATKPDWYRDLRQEFRAFPNGKYSDQVDCISQFVAWASSAFGSLRTGTAEPVRRRMEHEIHRR
jgi:predicted phage terminase large subunit-like protein